MKIGEHEYTIGVLSAMQQLMVVRKLGPALPVIEGITAERNSGKDTQVLSILMLSKLSDEDAQIVVNTCLGVVARKQGMEWAPIMRNGTLMFMDLVLEDMLRLVEAVIMENLGNFFRDALANLHRNGATL
jgi:hypothetical protein